MELGVRQYDIAIAEWLKLAEGGAMLPVRIQLSGHSMRPMVRERKDYVTICPIARPVRPGDIVLFQRADGRHVVHRVWKVQGESVQTLGDNCMTPDSRIPPGSVLGLVTDIERGARRIRVDNRRWRFLGRCWLAALPVRKRVRRLKYRAKALLTPAGRR